MDREQETENAPRPNENVEQNVSPPSAAGRTNQTPNQPNTARPPPRPVSPPQSLFSSGPEPDDEASTHFRTGIETEYDSVHARRPPRRARTFQRRHQARRESSTPPSTAPRQSNAPPPNARRHSAERTSQPRNSNRDLQQQVIRLTLLVENLMRNRPTSATNNNTQITRSRSELEELPSFDGQTLDVWLRFEASYQYLVRAGLTNDDLITGFNKALKGEAYNLVEHLLIIRSSNITVMEELRNFYGDSKKVINRMTRKVLRARPIKSSNDPELLEFAINIKRLITNIIYFERDYELESTYLQESIISKLCDDDQDHWRRQVNANPGFNLEQLSDFIMNRAREGAYRKVDLHLPQVVRGNGRSSKRNDAKQVNLHAVNEDVESEGDEPDDEDDIPLGAHFVGDRNNNGCFLCNEKHRLLECVLFLNRSVSERYIVVNSKGLCSCCLASKRHTWQNCANKIQCTVASCRQFHHPLLHHIEPLKNANTPVQPNAVQTAPSSTDHTQTQSTNATFSGTVGQIPSSSRHRGVLYGIIPVFIRDAQRNWQRVYVMVDSGSGATLISQELQERLGLVGAVSSLRLRWTDESTHYEPRSLRLQVVLRGENKKRTFSLDGVQTVSRLQLPKQSQDAAELNNMFEHLRGIPIASFVDAQPSILIGLPHVQLCFGSIIRSGKPNQPIAVKTPLGWIVLGNVTEQQRQLCPGVTSVTVHEARISLSGEAALEDAVNQFFQLDSYGVQPDQRLLYSKDEQRANEIVKRTMNRIGDRYEIGLFWRHDDIQLPDSYEMAFNRLKRFENHLLKNPELKEFVNKRIEALLANGHARIATEEDLSTQWPREWYLPIFVVINPHKPKPRLVCDAAATVRGVSLNSVQIPGPNLLVPIPGPLFRLRQYKIGVSGDVRDMFPQIRIIPIDQQCQRFIWRNCETDKEPTIYIHQGMIFGSNSSPFSAQIVKNTHVATHTTESPEACDALRHGTFVDDYADSRKNVHIAARVTNDAIRIMGEINLHLVNFQSNSPELLKLLPPTHVKPQFVNLEFDRGTPNYVTKVLGMKWETFEDVLQYLLDRTQLADQILTGLGATKRQLLSVIMKIYDPLGLISHFHIQGRLLLQEAWRSECDWDEPLPDEIQRKLADWVQKMLNEVTALKFPRCYTTIEDPDAAQIDLHIFTDASEWAMGTVAYFVLTLDDQVEVRQVFAKGKAMPLKNLSTPQAELVAAVMGVRVAQTINKLHTYRIHSTTFWTDSECVLAQLHTHKKLKSFFAVRINEILSSSKLHQWHHVPTGLNPADYVTKWHADALSPQCMWFQGPEFLRNSPEMWPKGRFDTADDSLVAVLLPDVQRSTVIQSLLNVEHNDWLTLVEAVARKLRNNEDGPMTPDELDAAEAQIFAHIQLEAFEDDVRELTDRGELSSHSDLLRLSPFMDQQGVIRLQSRLQNAPIPFTAKNPAILPNKHPLVELLIKHFHSLHDHVGENQIIAALRTRAWVIGTKSAVRRVASNCNECAVRRAQVRVPREADLPEIRVTPGELPFEHTGADVFGPVELTLGRTTVKRWVIIFTCMKTRAVHLEMLYDLSADEVLQALESFSMTRGRPKHIYTDQGTNFIGANNITRKDIEALQQVIGDQAALRYGITWHFNPSHTPHFGGTWERLIGAVKSGLGMAQVLKHRPSEKVFQRAIKAVEGRLNSRPLTDLSMNPDDDEPLTPNHFLLGYANNLGSPHITSPSDEFSKYGYRRVRYLQQIMWRRWLREYLPQLTLRSKWLKETDNMKIGDRVLVIDGNKDRDNWKKAVVIDTIPGKDKRVRVVIVRTEDGKQRRVSVINIARLPKSSSPETSSVTGGEDVVAHTTTM